jgi:hypothetical protein
MNELLAKVLTAHGGLERWSKYNKVDATIVSGGGFFSVNPHSCPVKLVGLAG